MRMYGEQSEREGRTRSGTTKTCTSRGDTQKRGKTLTLEGVSYETEGGLNLEAVEEFTVVMH